jgi:hypothetical protein
MARQPRAGDAMRIEFGHWAHKEKVRRDRSRIRNNWKITSDVIPAEAGIQGIIILDSSFRWNDNLKLYAVRIAIAQRHPA